MLMGGVGDTADMCGRVAELLAPFDGPVNTAHLLCDGHDPARTAYHIVAPDLSSRRLTYGDLTERSERCAAALASLGVGAGDRVATLMGKGVDLLAVVLGIWRLGAVHVPLFTAFAPPAIALRLKGSGAKVVVCDAAQEDKLDPGESIPADAPWRVVTTGPGDGGKRSLTSLLAADLPEVTAAVRHPDDPLIHIYTSGTTGDPKGVVVPVRALATFRAYGEFGYDLRPDDVFWNAADPGWAYGLYCGILASLTTGTPSVMLEGGFDAARTFAVMQRLGVTNFAAAPTVYRSLKSSGLAVPPGLALRCLSSAGEPLTPDINDWAQEAFGLLVHDHYGQTEMGMFINNHHHPRLKRPIRTGAMGHAMPGWRPVVLAEDRDEPAAPGEVGRVAIDLLESPFAYFTGYEGQADRSAEKFSPDGRWYYTGDVGFTDEDGYFHFSARDDDIIMMAGYRIGPFEVESVVCAHPQVVESAAIAVPDPIRGEVMECYVVLTSGATGSPQLAAEIQQWVKTRYAAHAYPRAVHFIEAMPKTPSGKIQRVVLKQRRIAELAGASPDREP
jgi:acetyl-CoA synthetase